MTVRQWPTLEPVIGLPLQTGWTDKGGGVYTPSAYYRDPDGIVHLQGTIDKGATGTAKVAIIPIPYRPALNLTFYAPHYDATTTIQAPGRIDCDPDGSIYAYGQPGAGGVASGDYISLDGLTFRPLGI